MSFNYNVYTNHDLTVSFYSSLFLDSIVPVIKIVE